MDKFRVLLGLFLLTSAAAADNVCSNGNIVNMRSEPFYWPSTWRENQTAPALKGMQSCSWTVTVPTGFFAKMIINGKTSGPLARFQMIDSAGNLAQSTEEGMQPYYFPATKFTLAVTTQNDASLGFKIVWAPMPKPLIGGTGIVLNPQLITPSSSIDQGIAYSSDTQLSLLTFPTDPTDLFSYRGILVYDGFNTNNMPYATNLFQIAQSDQQWISSNAVVYLMNLEPSNSTNALLLQEYSYIKDLRQYLKFSCPSNSTCTPTLDGGDGRSALVTVDGVEKTLVDIQMDPSASLSVYYGMPNDFGFMDSYNGTAINSLLPLKFQSRVVQFVLSSGSAQFTFTA